MNFLAISQQPPKEENREKIFQCRSESCAINAILFGGGVSHSPVLLFRQLLRSE